MPRNPDAKKCKAKSQVYGEDGWPMLGEDGHKQYKPCENWAMRGQEVCDIHGGRMGLAKIKGEERVIAAGVRRKVGAFLEAWSLPNVNPMEELLECVAKSSQVMRYLEFMVHELDPGVSFEVSMDGPTVYVEPSGFLGPDHLGDVRANVLVTMYRQSLIDHAKICKLALDAGVEERLVRMAASTTEQLFQAIDRSLDVTSMTYEQKSEFKMALAQELRKVVGTDGTVIDAESEPALTSG